MRFKTAVALVLLGLLTLLAGIGQKTVWAPAETVTATAPADAKAAPLTVIDQKLRTVEGGTVTIKVKGEGNFLLAAGRPDDVTAWVGKTAHNTVTGLSEDKKSLQVERTDGEAAAPSPAGSDLWVSSENASGELDYTWSAPADGEWSLLLASDGKKPAPSSISMTFPNDTSTPWAVPLMVIGALLMLAGAALLVLKPKGGNRGISGRGGSAAGPGNPFTKRAKAAVKTATGSSSSRMSVIVAASTAALLAGTGAAAQASQTPDPAATPGASSTAAPTADAGGGPVLLDAQFRRILEQVASATDSGDAAKDSKKLATRVAGSELEVRTQNYKIRSRVASYDARMPVRATKLLTTVVTSKRAWPRQVLAVTQGEGNVVPQLLTLVQKSPRENYKLVGTSPLQPGTTFPSIARNGTETLAAGDKSGLLYSGQEALSGLADRLSNEDSTFKSKLVEGESSPYIADTLSYQADVVKSGVNGKFAFTHKVVPDSAVVFRTADGGALVLGRLTFNFDGTPKSEGDKLSIGNDAAVLAGGKETTSGMVLNFAESVAVYVPPTGSKDPMKLVAATRGLVGASFK
ncbi:hypothetical protein [Arthrobacter pascens]|uniref:hypothetical protein n=1 Tax=Arthrobacter pascens TaxID=1677 RepID=UPI00196A93DC|nr:hypothetical protein [Arthrobacter pascens]MBN3498467.1 hypothetical protein [Arthrobacter pascens]MDR6556347.1 hypothetical protein [Arthrobacter pascens]